MSILADIKKPDARTVVVSRIYNWMMGLNEDVKPASCVVTWVDSPRFDDFFDRIANRLAESAGVNIVVDNLSYYIEEYLFDQYCSSDKGDVIALDSNNTAIDIQGLSEEYTIVRVADSLRMKSQKTKDKYPNHVSIFDAFKIAFRAKSTLSPLKVILDFADVRDKDEDSSGRESFIHVAKVISDFAESPTFESFLYTCSEICSTIKRGGFRRHGAMTTSLKTSSPDITKYVKIPFSYLSHIKKGVCFDILPSLPVLDLLIEAQNSGSLFFEKYAGISTGIDGKPRELRTNVCRGLNLIADDQCLVSPTNLGQCRTYTDITEGIIQTTRFLLDIYAKQQQLGFDLKDRQIASGLCGLANCLRNFRTDYKYFIQALTLVNEHIADLDNYVETTEETPLTIAIKIAIAMYEGFHVAAKYGRMANMRAIFAIEPTESCSRRVKDYNGYDTVPNIDPADIVAGIGIEQRHSDTGVFDYDGKKLDTKFNYGADIFPASALSEQEHFTLWNEIQKLMDTTGLAHGGCYEQWFPLTYMSFMQWWNSDLKFIYYNRSVGTKHLVKGNISNPAVSARQRLLDNTKSMVEAPQGACSLNPRNASECESCD
jgi:hypothetical protein